MKIIILVLFVITPSLAFSQDYAHILEFVVNKPKWNHLVIDSSRLENENFNRTSFLLSDNFYDIMTKDSFVYVKYFDNYSDYYSGSFIEKINFHNGQKCWSDVFGKDLSGNKELVSSIFINQEEQLEILSFFKINEQILGINDAYSISSRKYNDNTGELESMDFQQSFVGNDILYFGENNVIFPTVNNNYVYLEPNLEDDDGFPFIRKKFDEHLSFIASDTIKRSRKYFTRYLRKPYRFLDSLIVNQRHSTAQRYFEPPDTAAYNQYELWIDVFDSEFNQIDSLDIKKYMPYNWVFNTTILDDHLMIHCGDSINIPGIKQNNAKVFFDRKFNHVETIDLKKMDYLYAWSFEKLHDEPGFLFITDRFDQNNKVYFWDIYKSDGQGNLSLSSTLEIKNDFWNSCTFNATKLTSNNTLLFDYVALKTDNNDQIVRVVGIAAFDLEELGVVKTKEVSKTEKPLMKLFPNPVENHLFVEFPGHFTGQIHIYNEMAQRVQKFTVNQSKKKSISIQALDSGWYHLIAIHDQQIMHASFVKK